MLTFPSPFPLPLINPDRRQNAVRIVQVIKLRIKSKIKTNIPQPNLCMNQASLYTTAKSLFSSLFPVWKLQCLGKKKNQTKKKTLD